MADLDVNSPWLETPKPTEPARVGQKLRLPDGRIDTWDLVVGLGAAVDPGHWRTDTKSTQFAGPDEFRRASVYFHDEGVKKASIEGLMEMAEFAAKEEGSEPPNRADVKRLAEKYHFDALEEDRPYYDRYRKVVDAILQHLIDGLIKAEVAYSAGQVISISRNAWRSSSAQKALSAGVACERDGFIIDSRNPRDFVHLIFPKSAVAVVKASLMASPIESNRACEDFLLNLMIADPFGHAALKEHKKLAIEHGVFLSDRKFRAARTAAIKRLKMSLDEEDKEKVRYDRPGKRPA